MNSTKIASIGLAAAVTAILPAAPAQAAGAARTFLSAAGSDANNCTNVATPCRHLAAAFAATAADGEIYVLDPANYGSLTITHAVSIEGHGWASIAPVSGQAAITINAPGATDKINIIGVVLDGTAIASTTGIQFNSGGSLTVRDSVIRNFTLNGVNFVPNSSTANQISVSNTEVSDNGANGILISPSGSGTTNGVLDHVAANNNGNNGIAFQKATTSPTVFGQVKDSIASGNIGAGFYLQGDSNPQTIAALVVFQSVAGRNGTGLEVHGANALLRIGHAVVSGNHISWSAQFSSGVVSYGDNYIYANDDGDPAPPIQAHK
jgi:hypothetical protein